MNQGKASRLAIAAIALALPGICFFPFAIVGGALGAFALVKGKTGNGTGKTIAILAVAILPITVFTTGIAAAIAIPAFATYIRRSKTAEAHDNVKAIARGVQQAYGQQGELPASIAPLPEGDPSDLKRSWPATSPAGQAFAKLGFSPSAALFYGYEYARAEDGQTFVVTAHGDLDGDGTPSSFSIEGRVEGKDVTLTPLYVENELE